MSEENEHVKIFDTTLRDGEQAPGCSMTLREKLRVAEILDELKVDVIEAGFAAASPGDFDSVSAVAEQIKNASVCSLARCNPEDIEKAAKAVAGAKYPRIHVFVATSDIHRKFKLNMAKEEVIRSAVGGVKLAREHCDDVEFSPEDASRTEPAFLAEVVTAAIEAGASTINVPDTVGYTVPGEFFDLFDYLRKNVSNIDRAILSVHCHDDLGMAVANSLAAVRAGARQVECTINGIGERAGNCSLEEIVMALRTRPDFFGVDSRIDATRLYPAARLVSSITGMSIPRNKAVVGENAFAHEAGIHQHGMIKNRATYEIMKPEDVGIAQSSLVLGKHSGRHAFRERAEALGFELDDFELNRSFQEFKKLADQKKDMFDADIEAIIMSAGGASDGPWVLSDFEITLSADSAATARVELTNEAGEQSGAEAFGVGPIESAAAAITSITGLELTLKNFEMRSITMGEDAQAEAIVTVDHDGMAYRGRGVSIDIVEAGARAHLEVSNRILRRIAAGVRPSTGSKTTHANV